MYIKRDPRFGELAKRGITFHDHVKFILDDKTSMAKIASDAALLTPPNAGVPIEFTAFVDAEVWSIQTAARGAKEIWDLRQKGNWLNSHVRWGFHEPAGMTGPFSDRSDAPTTNANHVWPTRQQYIFQTNIGYGLREQELLGEAKISYAASLQRAASEIIEIDHNKFWLLGVDGMEIYGALNDPMNTAAVAATAPFNTLDSVGVYNEVRELFRVLATNSNGIIKNTSNLKLLVSPNVNVDLGASSTYNQTALEMIQKFMPNLEVIVIPELADLPTGDQVFLISSEIRGQRAGDLGYGSLIDFSAVVQTQPTWWVQKAWASTYGFINYYPFAIARMTGVTA